MEEDAVFKAFGFDRIGRKREDNREEFSIVAFMGFGPAFITVLLRLMLVDGWKG